MNRWIIHSYSNMIENCSYRSSETESAISITPDYMTGFRYLRIDPVTSSDVYSYGLVNLSILTGKSKAGNDREPLDELGIRKFSCNNLVFVVAALVATLTFQTGLSPMGGCFLWFNSAVFLASEAVVVSVALQLPLRRWLVVAAFSLFGAYLCGVMVAAPRTAVVVMCVGSPLLLKIVFLRGRGNV